MALKRSRTSSIKPSRNRLKSRPPSCPVKGSETSAPVAASGRGKLSMEAVPLGTRSPWEWSSWWRVAFLFFPVGAECLCWSCCWIDSVRKKRVQHSKLSCRIVRSRPAGDYVSIGGWGEALSANFGVPFRSAKVVRGRGLGGRTQARVRSYSRRPANGMRWVVVVKVWSNETAMWL